MWAGQRRTPRVTRYSRGTQMPSSVVEGDKIASQLGAARLVEVTGERLGRSIAHREGVPRRLAAWLAIERGSLFEVEVEGAAEQLADTFRFAPFERRGRRRTWGRRHIRLHHQEHLEKIAVGEPRSERHASALTGHSRDFGGRRLGAAREHHAAGGDDGVELAVGEGQFFRVANAIFNIKAFGLGALTRSGDQIRCDIGPDHFSTSSRDQTRGPARTRS